jgi:hypothetical protein
MGRHCFDTSALDGGLSETAYGSKMARQKHNLAALFAGDSFRATFFFALLKIVCFIIGRTIRNFRGHIHRNGINVCDRINRNPH